MHREGGESCTSCVELARENGELRAARKGRRRLAWAQAAGGSAMVGAMIGGALMLTSWIHGCASRPEVVPPSSCVEKAELIRTTDLDPQTICSKGSRLAFDRLEISDAVLVRCVCPGGVDGAELSGPRAEASAPPGAR